MSRKPPSNPDGRWLQLAHGGNIMPVSQPALRIDIAIARAFRLLLANQYDSGAHAIIAADRCTYDFDLGTTLWFGKAAWTRLCNTYIDHDELNEFYERADYIIAHPEKPRAYTMRFKQRPFCDKRKTGEWGGCLLTLSIVRSSPVDLALALHSRTSFLGYTGMLDAAIVAVIADLLGIARDARFVWTIDLAQIHPLKGLYYYHHVNGSTVRPQGKAGRAIEGYDRRIREAYRVHGADIGLPIERRDENPDAYEVYGPLRRVKRRFLCTYLGDETHMSPPKPMPVHDLTIPEPRKPKRRTK